MHDAPLGGAMRAIAPEVERRLPVGVRLRHAGLGAWDVVAAMGFYARRIAEREPSTEANLVGALQRGEPVLVSENVLSRAQARGLREAKVCAASMGLRLLCQR
jgi:hypothetical protein